MVDKFQFPFEKLEVWQLAVDFADFIMSLLESLPPNKHLRPIGQMETAACSIAQNIESHLTLFAMLLKRSDPQT